MSVYRIVPNNEFYKYDTGRWKVERAEIRSVWYWLFFKRSAIVWVDVYGNYQTEQEAEEHIKREIETDKKRLEFEEHIKTPPRIYPR